MSSSNRFSNFGSHTRHILRFAGILLLIALPQLGARPQSQPVVLGEPQTVVSNHPILGVHTRLTDEVEPWKIKRTLQLVREMGATTIVEFFPWAYYEPNDDDFHWHHPDLVIDHATTQGLQVIARIGLVPDWARPEETPLNYLDDDGYAPFADFVAAFAKRYQGRVNHIIILNEPNLTFEWGGQQTTPADYVALLQTVYPAVKAVAPEVQILAGALAPTLEPTGSPNGQNDLDYLRGMYEAGGAAYFDALAVHAYGLTFPPAAAPQPDVLNYRRVELLRAIMLEFGDTRPVYITESGYNDHPRWTRAVRPAQRLNWTIDLITFAEENWPYVETVALWMFRTPAPSKNFLDYFTLVTPEFVEKPIYSALQAFTGNNE